MCRPLVSAKANEFLRKRRRCIPYATPAPKTNWQVAMIRGALVTAIAVASFAASPAMAADMALKAPASSANCDPYANYSCLDGYLGDDFVTRLYRYYALEWGHDGPPSDPKAPPSRRSDADTTIHAPYAIH
jgi:hypothetical protein